MIGPEKLSTIREKVRASFKMDEAQLRAWFEDQLEEMQRKPQTAPTEIETLRLFRDALVKETKNDKPKRKPRRVTARTKK
jgi:hypothetical protein